MQTSKLLFIHVGMVALFGNVARAQAEAPQPARAQVEAAAARGLKIVEKAAANYPNNRNCFSCHHQTLPMLAMVAVRDSTAKFDVKLMSEQAKFTHQSFLGRVDGMKEGKGIGGQAMTVAYGLWAMDIAGWKPDETTEAMVTFLLKTQQPDGFWGYQTRRPPLEDSKVMCTVLSVYGLQKYATESQKELTELAITRAKDWLATTPTESQEDRAARLWGLHLLDAQEAQLREARQKLLAGQREDGGWAQLDDMESDAYATGQTMWVLRETGLPPADAAYSRGVAFLLKTQCDDGSWFVKTRSKPIQVFFDNGDPHGEHQFISIPATSWAVAALAAAIDTPKPGTVRSGK